MLLPTPAAALAVLAATGQHILYEGPSPPEALTFLRGGQHLHPSCDSFDLWLWGQVRLLYGPLLACVHATRTAYAAMVRQHSPDGKTEGFVRAVREHPGGAEGEAYR